MELSISQRNLAAVNARDRKISGTDTPAIIQIPGVSGNTGAGVAGVKKSVEQAVGSDIIFGRSRLIRPYEHRND